MIKSKQVMLRSAFMNKQRDVYAECATGQIKLVLIQLKRVFFCSCGVGSLTLCVTGLNSIKVLINPNKVV